VTARAQSWVNMSVAGARIDLWVQEREGSPALSAVLRALTDDLQARGARVELVLPERDMLDPRRVSRPDLVLLRTTTTMGLAIAQGYEASGVRFLNGARETVRAHRPATVGKVLAHAGVPVPLTFAAAGAVERRGSRPAGVATLPQRSPLLDFDRRRMPSGVRVYVAGEALFAARKRVSALTSMGPQMEPVALNERAAATARAAAAALGLRLVGLDMRYEAGQPMVTDVEPLPAFRGFPTAVAALTAEVERALEAR
jgi:glutathione synthase/RimK-type ligase-like ATP-grasp enzyme